MARKIEVQIVGDASSLHKALGSVQTRTRRFGSFMGTSFRAASIAGTAGLVGLGIAAKDLFDDFSDGQKATAQTRAVIKSTGGVAGVTTKHVQDLATTIQGYSGIQDDVVQSGENMLLTFKNIRNEAGKGNDVFDQSTKILADMSQALGEDMPKAAIQLGKALNDPVKGITALQRVGVTFTDGQKKQIDAMVKSGNVMGAQKLILGELRSEFGGSAKAAGSTFAGQMNILRGAFENAGSAIIGKLLPYITRFAQFAIPLAVKGIDQLAKGITRLVGYFINLGGHVGVTSNKVHSAMAGIAQFFQGRVMPVVRQLVAIFRQAFAAIAKTVQQHGAELGRIATRIGQLLKAIAIVAIPILRFALVKVLPVAIGATITWLDHLTGAIAKIITTAISVGKKIGHAFGTIVAAAKRLWGDISGPLNSIWNAFERIAGAIQSVIDKIGALISKIPSIPHLPSLGSLNPFAVSRGGGSITPVASAVHVHVMLDRRELGRAIIDLDKDHRRQNAGRALLSGVSS
jgi:phage-related protein